MDPSNRSRPEHTQARIKAAPIDWLEHLKPELTDVELADARMAMLNYIEKIMQRKEEVERAINVAKQHSNDVKALDMLWMGSWEENGYVLTDELHKWFDEKWPKKVSEYRIKTDEIEKAKDMADYLVFTFLRSYWLSAQDYESIRQYRSFVQLRRAQHLAQTHENEIKHRGFTRILELEIEQWVPGWEATGL
ncbi:MAG: hypothetical protein Q9200_000016 [Gallowayella weberi]